MAYRIDDDENRTQDIQDQIDSLEVQTFSTEVVARNESTRNTGVQTGEGAATNPYPQWIPIRDFGDVGLVTQEIVLNRTDSHVAKMTIIGDVDFAFSIPPGTNKMMWFILDVTIDGTGGYAINLPGTVEPASTTIDNTANARTILRFTTTDGGATYQAENLVSSGGNGDSPPFFDNIDLIKNSADPTKLLRFSAALISSNTTRTLSVPNSSTTLAGLGVVSQLWTGTNAFIGTTTVIDVSFGIRDNTDNTKVASFNSSLISSNTTRILSLPNSSTTLAGLGVVSQLWTGTNAFVGTTTVIDVSFGIRDNTDNTKVASFNSSLISSNTTRILSLPNSSTTLAGLGVVSQSWTGTNTYAGPTVMNGNVTLGSNSSDNIIFNGDVVNSITPNMNDTYDLGASSLQWRQLYLETQFNLFEGLAAGFAPASKVDTGILFCRPNGSLTELRIIFQTGVSKLIISE